MNDKQIKYFLYALEYEMEKLENDLDNDSYMQIPCRCDEMIDKLNEIKDLANNVYKNQ